MNTSHRELTFRAALTALCLAACLALTPEAGAVSRGPYSMEVLVDGRPLLLDGVLQTIDEERVMAEARTRADRLLGR